MATLLHGLGDYITSWAQPSVDFSPTANRHRFEGGMKTEYAFFGGFMGGYTTDGVHYDYARIRMFNSSMLPEYWMIPDHVAREYYASETISKFHESILTKLSVSTGPTNTIRQMDLCCGWHRLVWRPIHRPPQDQQQYYQQGYYGQQQGGSGGSWGYPSPQQSQQGFGSYGSAPGTNFSSSQAVASSFPPASNFGGGGQFAMSFPPPMAPSQFQWQPDASWSQDQSWGAPQQQSPSQSPNSGGNATTRRESQRGSGSGGGGAGGTT